MKEKKYLVLGITLVLLTFVGVSLAYFLTTIEGDRKNITINTSDLRVIFTNGDAIEGTEIEPGWSVTKTFSVENKTKNEYKYNIVIEDLVNTFKTTGYLQYKITSTDGGYNMTDFEDVPKSSIATNTVLVYSVSIPAKSIQNYTITIQYKNDENVDQSIDSLLDAVVTGKLYINEGTYPTLSEVILRDNPTISERTDFNVINTANTTGTIYQTNKTEDGSTVYYYSGNTSKNWVKFAGFYWRIIRTNEDGSVRLLYAGTNHNTTSGYIVLSKFNENYNDPMYAGYMYGTTGSLANNRTNTNDSTVKTAVDTWYENNLLANYDKYISKTTIYCNDRSISSDYTYSTSSSFDYGTSTRLADNKAPTYKCGGNTSDGLFESTQAIADKFSASTEGGGNGQLTYPIALMTADEVAFAGGKKWTELNSPYAWYYTNSQGETITRGTWWWSLSPYGWDGSDASVWFVYGSVNPGGLGLGNVQDGYGVRPSVSLASCVGIKSGNGTPESPYEIDESSCS